MSEEALVVGAASEPVHLDLSSNESDILVSPEEPFPLYALERPVNLFHFFKYAIVRLNHEAPFACRMDSHHRHTKSHLTVEGCGLFNG